MTDHLVLYTHPMSRGRIARWMLEETGADYRTEILEYGPMMKSEAYLAPSTRWARCRRSDTATPWSPRRPPSAPTSPMPSRRQVSRQRPGERGAYYRWLFFAAGPLEAATTNRFLGFEPPADRQPMVGYGNYETTMNALEHAVSGRRLHRGRALLRRRHLRGIARRLGAC